MGCSQPQVHLALSQLMKRGFVEKDANQRPQRYYLSPLLLGGERNPERLAS